MAIQKNKSVIVHGKEVTYENCYIRIENINGDKSFLNFDVVFYTNETCNIEIQREVHGFIPAEDVYSIRWDKQAYEYLKTQSYFLNAIDV